MSNNNCLFCRIAAGEIPADIIYEDDTMVVFRDIGPQAPVHLLIVPRKHIRNINDLTEGDAGIISEMFLVARQLARQNAIAETGYKLFMNIEKGGGQRVFHLHMHLVGGWPEKEARL